MNKFTIITSSLLFAFLSTNSYSSPLVYQPFSPTFGGSSYNAAHFSTIVNSQNAHEKERHRKTALERFQERLESRLFSQLSNSILNDIVDEEGQFKPGSTETDSYKIDVVETLDGQFTITTYEKETGATTTFTLENL